MIIDIHTHQFEQKDSPEPRLDMDAVVKGMRELGIAKSLVCPLCNGHNRSILELSLKYPGFFIPFGFFQLGQDEPPIIQDLFDQGFKGIKLIHNPSPYTDRAYWPVYEQIQKLGMPVLFHTAIQPETQPEHLETVSRNFPEMKCIGSHLGYPWYNEACCVSQRRPNVWFDLSTNQLIYFERNTGKGKCRPQIKMLYETGEMDTNKILFGSDVFYNRKAYSTYQGQPADTVGFVESVIQDHQTAFDDMGLSATERENIFYHNAATLLGI